MITITESHDPTPSERAAVQAEIRRRKNKRLRERERQRRKRQRRIIAAGLLAVPLIVGFVVAVTFTACSKEDVEEPTPAVDVIVTPSVPTPSADLVAEATYTAEDERKLAMSYYSIIIPMPFEYQEYMRTYCEKYNCPFPLALAVAQVESDFDMDAIGSSGEVGIMQINPGPGGAYHAEIAAVTGLSPETPEGNIAAGCYLLGKYLEEFGDYNEAVMAYNMGHAGAADAIRNGTTSTNYSRVVVEAMQTWQYWVNAWNGI